MKLGLLRGCFFARSYAIVCLATPACHGDREFHREKIRDVDRDRLLGAVVEAYNSKSEEQFLNLVHPNSDIHNIWKEVVNISMIFDEDYKRTGGMKGIKTVNFDLDSGTLGVDVIYEKIGIVKGYIKFDYFNGEWYILELNFL
jgi:hypothetical protein